MKNLKGLITLFLLIVSIGFVACSVEDEASEDHQDTMLQKLMEAREKAVGYTQEELIALGADLKSPTNTCDGCTVMGIFCGTVYNIGTAYYFDPDGTGPELAYRVPQEFALAICDPIQRTPMPQIFACEPWTNSSGVCSDVTFFVIRMENGSTWGWAEEVPTGACANTESTFTPMPDLDCPQK